MKEKKKIKSSVRGRPTGTTVLSSNRYVPLSVRIPQYLLDRISKVSKKKNQTRSQTLLDAIDDYLLEQQILWKEE